MTGLYFAVSSFALGAGAPAYGPVGMVQPVAEAVFWVSVLLLGYVVIGYPLSVVAWAAVKPRPYRTQSFEPTVSIVIAAHNEAPRIEKKVANLLKLDYPADRLEILLGSDGSTDGTVERLRRIFEAHIRIVILPERRGKPAVLNTLVPKARGEIVVLADVRQQFDPQILRALVQPFADPRVGAVSGELIITENPNCTAIGNCAGAYWRYEKFIRCHESRLDSTVGATGAIYAIRRDLFEPIPEDTILDDVLIPLRITRRGYRVLFQPEARAYDRPPATAGEEFLRKARTLSGNFQLFAREPWLLSPTHNRLWWQTISHKGLRLFIPILQLAALVSNSFLFQQAVLYQFALLAQVLFYTGALAGCFLQHSRRKFWPVTFSYLFCLLSWATVVGFLRGLRGSQTVMWEKVPSEELPSGSINLSIKEHSDETTRLAADEVQVHVSS